MTDLGSFRVWPERNHEGSCYGMRIRSRDVAIDGRNDGIKAYDDMLHQSLSKTFDEHCLNSCEVKEFVRAPAKYADKNSMIKLIQKKEPVIGRQFPSGEFKDLSLLWIAALCCYHTTLELLVRSGADVNEPFGCRKPQLIDEKWTVLHVLLQMEDSPENERLIRLVTDHGADLQVRDSFDRTILHFALKRAREVEGQVHHRLTEMFLEKGARNVIDVADKMNTTPLLLAADCKYEADKLLMLLMKHGADVKVRDITGRNALHRLSSLHFANVERSARALIEKGVSIEDRESLYDYQPLHLAAESGDNVLVKLYLDHGANVNARKSMGIFPLYLATSHYPVLKTLLERGADIHQRTVRGGTALHGACHNFTLNGSENIGLLLSAGADLLTEDHFGNTPFALIKPRYRIIENLSIQLLLKALAEKKACLQPSTELKDEMIIEECPRLWDYYRDCLAHVSRMQHTRLVGSCTFFELLAKNSCQIAALMRNPAFEANFKLYDLSRFSMYAKDVLRAFERAQDLYHSMLKMEAVINEAVYNILPYVVVRKVVDYMFLSY